MYKKRLLSLFFVLLFITTSFISCGKTKYLVDFQTGGGTHVDSILLNENSLIKKPDDPQKNGYQFINWSFNGKKWNFDVQVVTSDMTLDAVWNPVVYIIKYNLDGGENNEENPYNFTVLSDISLLDPTKPGSQFDGWYLDKELTIRIFAIEKGTTNDIELFAKWKS